MTRSHDDSEHQAGAGLDPDTVRRLRVGTNPKGRAIEVDRARRSVHVPSRSAKRRRQSFLGLASVDLGVGALLMLVAPFLKYQDSANRPVVYALTIATMMAAVFVAGGYRIDLRARLGARAAIGVFLGLLLGWLGLKLIGEKLDTSMVPPAIFGFLGVAMLAATVLGAARMALAAMLRREEARAQILFVGGTETADRLRNGLAERGHPNPFAHFAPHAMPGEPGRALSQLDASLTGAVRAIVLGVPLDSLPQSTIADLVHCRVMNVPIMTESQFVEELWQRVPLVSEDLAWALFGDEVNPARSVSFWGAKRLIDLLGAGVGFVLAVPVVTLAALAIKLDSRGPVLFKQVRTGLWKQPFTIYKLRTMAVDAEADGARWASSGDVRITRVGNFLRRSRIDELPQLINVLRGDMSLVGPRPERPEFNMHLEKGIPFYDLRHLVKPGVTGWAQVCYRYGASFDDALAKAEYDVYYVKHASLAFDLRILARTVGVVLGAKGR